MMFPVSFPFYQDTEPVCCRVVHPVEAEANQLQCVPNALYRDEMCGLSIPADQGRGKKENGRSGRQRESKQVLLLSASHWVGAFPEAAFFFFFLKTTRPKSVITNLILQVMKSY